MSGLAKVFLVINLVLAIIFLGTSATLFSVRKDWKTESEKFQAAYVKQFDQQVADIKKLEENVGLWTNVVSAQFAETVSLRTDNKALTDKLNAASAELTQAKTEIGKKDAVLTKQQTELTDLSGQVKSLATTLDAAKKSSDDANDKARKFNSLANQNVLQSQQLQEQLEAALKEVESLRAENEQLKIQVNLAATGVTPGNTTPAGPPLKGKVMGVREDLVVLSLGKDESVKPGMVFRVSRGSQYVGEIQVRTVYKDMSGAQIVYLVEGTQIQEGDDAQTAY
jgi:hypothetical protein